MDIVIGIDPDIDKNGVAVVRPATREVEVMLLTFIELMEYLESVKKEAAATSARVLVVVEAGWKNPGVWHLGHTRSIAAAAQIGVHTGRNHEVSHKVADFARHMQFEVEESKPLMKVWKGPNKKITHKELCSLIGQKIKHTNQEGRDAVLLAWVKSGLPLHMGLLEI